MILLFSAINEQQENIGKIVAEVNRSREELAKSFAGAEIGANQKIQETLQRLTNQMGTLQHKTLELERKTSLDWRMQSIEDDLTELQVKFQGGSQLSGQDRVIAQLSQQVQELSQNPLWHEMQKTKVEIQHFKKGLIQ